MPALFEIVPNVSEGRDPAVLDALVRAVEGAGADVLDASSDPDHHRSVLTAVGTADQVVAAGLALAATALERIDLRHHQGVHPRIGALDVLPFVPLVGATLEDARALALEAAEGIAALGVPVYLYGWASDPPGRGLADLRKGGFEGLRLAWPEDREPDRIPQVWGHRGIHPTAGATCVGARSVLLAWNVYVEGLEIEHLKHIARAIRERSGGFAGLRALAFSLPSTGRMQISMNLEDPNGTSPFAVFDSVEKRVEESGGRVVETEIIGMIPDALLLTAATDRLRLGGAGSERLLSARVARAIGRRWRE